jgi:hypothetical protein
MYAVIRRTPWGLATFTVTGLLSPTIFTSGEMLSTVPEDITKSAVTPRTAKITIAMIAFTVGS